MSLNPVQSDYFDGPCGRCWWFPPGKCDCPCHVRQESDPGGDRG